VGFVLNGLALWATYGDDSMEHVEVDRVNAPAPTAPVRTVARSGNRLKLSVWEFSRAEWNLIVARLKQQDWLFNRDVFVGIVPNLTRRGVWDGVREDWENQDYLYQEGRSWWVRPAVRRKLLNPPTPLADLAPEWLFVDDDDRDDEEN